METQFNNLALASFYFWLDNIILDKGKAYTNTSSLFYPINSPYYGISAYALPYKQVVSDNSITGANFLNIFLNSTQIQTGVSGLASLDYNEGQLYFNNPVTGVLSGNYAVKDFNIYLNNEPEEQLLFETKLQLRPKIGQTITGLAPDTQTFPAIYINSTDESNEPFAFGGMDNTVQTIRAIVIADSQFSLDAVTSILRDTVRKNIPLLAESEWPYNPYEGFPIQSFNYSNFLINRTDWIYVNRVFVSKLNNVYSILPDLKALNPSIYPAFVDFELSTIRFPRN